MKKPQASFVRKFRRELLAWYKGHCRDLPWRRTSDPYQIWISEVMLQQTRVETVIPYYERFIQALPNAHVLATAPQQQVLKLWEGLGYYSRARNLQSAAKELVESYGGALPKTREKLEALKGFGPYTSAAVASIAYGEPVACVDGNVRRVLSRIFATHEPIEKLAQQLVDPNDPSSFNQGMMELGATVCLPRTPRCSYCPLQSLCSARLEERIHEFPAAKLKKPVPKIELDAWVIHSNGAVLLRQRPKKGLWAGLWEFPTMERDVSFLPNVQKTLAGSFIHQLTHRTMKVRVLKSIGHVPATQLQGKWVKTTDIEKYPISRLAQKVAAMAFA